MATMTMKKTNPDDLITDKEAAEALGLAQVTLKKMRQDGRGPAYFKIDGRKIRYDRRDLEAWAAQHRPPAIERISTDDQR